MSLRRLTGKILRFIFTTNSAIWLVKDLTEELTDYQAKIPVEIDMNPIGQTIEWLKSQNQSWVTNPQEIATALEYNHCWPSVRTNGKIIGCIKIGFRNPYIVDYNRVIELPERMAFIYDSYVIQGQRGKGVAKYLLTQAFKFLKAQGYTRVGGYVASWNKASIRACEKIGYKKASYIRYFRIFGVSIRIAKPTKESSMFKEGRMLKGDITYD